MRPALVGAILRTDLDAMLWNSLRPPDRNAVTDNR
jgi:hypothetical protein